VLYVGPELLMPLASAAAAAAGAVLMFGRRAAARIRALASVATLRHALGRRGPPVARDATAALEGKASTRKGRRKRRRRDRR
jgi:hypothetical protein